MIKNMPLNDQASSLKRMLKRLKVWMMLQNIYSGSRRITREWISIIKILLILRRWKNSEDTPMKIVITSIKTKDSPNIKEQSMDIVIFVTSLVTRFMIVESKKKIKVWKGKKTLTSQMVKDLLYVSYVTLLDTLQNIARTVHANCLRKYKKRYGRWKPRDKEMKNQ